MSKKLEKKIIENFERAINFEHFTSQAQPGAEPVGRDFLNQLVSELHRVNSFDIPLVAHHIENIDGIPTPTEYPTNFQKIKQQLAYIQFLYEELEELQNRLVNYPKSDSCKTDDVIAFNQSHEKIAQAKFTLGLLIGAHNQEMNSAYYTESGITKLQTEQVKSLNKYNKKYGKALELTQIVLAHFYSIEKNRPFKPNLVINYIEMLCNENNVDYPKDMKSEVFKDSINAFLKEITPHPNWNGASKDEYKQIDKKFFMKEYKPFMRQLLQK